MPCLAVRDDGHDEKDGADEFSAAHDARHGLRVHGVDREEQRGDLGDGPWEVRVSVELVHVGSTKSQVEAERSR